jgi:hypothetical protein
VIAVSRAKPRSIGSSSTADDADPDFAQWVKRNPLPDLQELVARFGDYSAIPPDAWAGYDADMVRWQKRRRARTLMR